MKPTPEQWQEWRQGSMGQWFFDQYLPTREAQMRDVWAAESWQGGHVERERLVDLKARAEALRHVREAGLDGILQDLETR